MASEEGLRRAAQTVRVDMAAEFHAELHDVGVGCALRELGVEEQSGLQRRERPDVVQCVVSGLQPVDRGLVEIDEADVGGRQPAGTRPRRVAGECRHGVAPQFGELGDFRGGEHAGRVVPRGGQGGAVRVIGDDRVDAEHGCHGCVGILAAAAGVSTCGQPSAVPQFRRYGVETAEIVEAHLRGRQRTQDAGGIGVEIAQQPIADSMAGNLPELFLDRFDDRPRGSARGERVVDVDIGQVEPHRVGGREPTDRPREVGTGEHCVVTAVAFQGEQRFGHVVAATTPPSCQCQCEPGDEGVVHVAAESLRQGGEHRAGHRGRQCHLDGGDGCLHVHVRVERAGTDRWLSGIEGGSPPVEFIEALGRSAQAVRPASHRGADRRELRLLPGTDLGPCGGQVRNQDPPRHPVDDQVVRDDEQSSGPVGPVEPNQLQHDSRAGVEAFGGRVRLGGGDRGEVGAVRRRCHRHAPDQLGGGHRGRLHLQCPAGRMRGFGTHPGPQHVVVIEHRLHGGLDSGHVDAARQRERHPLAETVVPAALEHPAHDRRQRYRSHATAREFRRQGDNRCAVANRDLSQSGDRLPLEHIPRGEHHIGCPGSGDQLDRHDAVAAQGEERIIETDPVDAQYLAE